MSWTLISLPPERPVIHINPASIDAIEPQGAEACHIHTRAGQTIAVPMRSADVLAAIAVARGQQEREPVWYQADGATEPERTNDVTYRH